MAVDEEWSAEDWYTDFELWCADHPEAGDTMDQQIEAYYASFPRNTEAMG